MQKKIVKIENFPEILVKVNFRFQFSVSASVFAKNSQNKNRQNTAVQYNEQTPGSGTEYY